MLQTTQLSDEEAKELMERLGIEERERDPEQSGSYDDTSAEQSPIAGLLSELYRSGVGRSPFRSSSNDVPR